MRATLVLLFLLGLACSGGPPATPAPAMPALTTSTPASASLPAAPIRAPVVGAPVAAGSLAVLTSFADYLVIVPASGDAEAVATAMRAALQARGVPLLDDTPDHPTGLGAVVTTAPKTGSGFEPAMLEYFGVDLTDGDVAGLTAATQVVALSVSGPPAVALDVQHAGAELVGPAAATANGWVVDLWTAQTWPPASFAKARPTGFPADVNQLMVVHLVPDEPEARGAQPAGHRRRGVAGLCGAPCARERPGGRGAHGRY
jgi:hypothetical protein